MGCAERDGELKIEKIKKRKDIRTQGPRRTYVSASPYICLAAYVYMSRSARRDVNRNRWQGTPLLSGDIEGDACGRAVGTHRWILLQELEVDGGGGGEAEEDGTADAACDVLEEAGGDGHLVLHEVEEVGIGDGAVEFIGGQRAGEVGLNGEVEDEICPHGALLREHAVEGKDSHIL